MTTRTRLRKSHKTPWFLQLAASYRGYSPSSLTNATRLNDFAQLLEDSCPPHAPEPDQIRIMNLPYPNGRCDLALLRLKNIPDWLPHGRLGRILENPEHTAVLAQLIDHGPVPSPGDLHSTLLIQGLRLPTESWRALNASRLVRTDPRTGWVSAHPALTAGIAELTVYNETVPRPCRRPQWPHAHHMLDFAHRAYRPASEEDDDEFPGWVRIKRRNKSGPDTALFLNVLSGALLAMAHIPSPDDAPWAIIRPGWLNAAHVC